MPGDVEGATVGEVELVDERVVLGAQQSEVASKASGNEVPANQKEFMFLEQ